MSEPSGLKQRDAYRRQLSPALLAVTIGAALAGISLFSAGSASGATGILSVVLIAIGLAAAPHGLDWFTRIAAGLLLVLLLLMATGFLLLPVGVFLDHRAAAVTALIIGVASIAVLVTVDYNRRLNKVSVTDLLKTNPRLSGDGIARTDVKRLRTIAALTIVAILAATAVGVSYFSDNHFQAEQGFVSLSVIGSSQATAETRTVTTLVTNSTMTKETFTLRIVVDDGRPQQSVHVSVEAGSTARSQIRTTSQNTVRLVLTGDAEGRSVLRTVILRPVRPT